MTIENLLESDKSIPELKLLRSLGVPVTFEKGKSVVSQYARSHFLYFLLEGELSFSIKIKDEPEELVVGIADRPYTPVGWSGFKEPYRYATTVRTTSKSKFIRFGYKELLDVLLSKPHIGCLFLKGVGERANLLLLETRGVLANLVPASKQSFLELDKFETIQSDAPVVILEALQKSPFFEIFTELELKQLGELAVVRKVERGEKLFSQGKPTDSILLLLQGKMALVHSIATSKSHLDKRIVQDQGYLLSVEGLITNSGHTETCVSLEASSVLELPLDQLNLLFESEPGLSYSFFKRILWYISVRLRSARAKLIRVNYDGEISAVKHIIEQHATQLNVLSEIHKIPILLSHTVTLKDAIQSLHSIKALGNSLERRLARTSLGLLSEVVKENDFYRGLASIYAAIVDAPAVFTSEENRNLCAESFCDLFNKVGFQLKGIENLPSEPAIYIYNHLENHIYNTLPNGFQLTLDSHFISSIILYRNFGNPGIRVVRVPKGEEFGHQLYYDKLGHIPVYTQDSEQLEETIAEQKKRREHFYETAAAYLQNGTSILLAPEGRSFTTEQSPGDFKAGAFVLASKLQKEPLIVPIAVANFDKRLNRTVYSASIKKPFKLSDKVKDPTNRDEMNSFLTDLKREYVSYIKEASEVDNSKDWTHLL